MSNKRSIILHFNEKRRKFSHYFDAFTTSVIDGDIDEVDTLKIDDHSRITFTKRMKKIFSVDRGDTVKVYHDRKKDEIIFSILRRGRIIEKLFCKRMEKDGQHVVTSYEMSSTPYHITDDDRMQSSTTIPKLNNTTNTNNLNYYNNNKRYFQKDTPNIMIVDDEEDVLVTCKSLLNQIDVNVETFSSSQQAIIHFVQVGPLCYDLIILNIKMPVINAFKLYTIMEALGVHSSKFLFVSALDYAEEFMQILPGIRQTNFIKKPIESEALLQKIKEALDVTVTS
jgi:CheY-like chemotaxis protein